MTAVANEVLTLVDRDLSVNRNNFCFTDIKQPGIPAHYPGLSCAGDLFVCPSSQTFVARTLIAAACVRCGRLLSIVWCEAG